MIIIFIDWQYIASPMHKICQHQVHSLVWNGFEKRSESLQIYKAPEQPCESSTRFSEALRLQFWFELTTLPKSPDMYIYVVQPCPKIFSDYLPECQSQVSDNIEYENEHILKT